MVAALTAAQAQAIDSPDPAPAEPSPPVPTEPTSAEPSPPAPDATEPGDVGNGVSFAFSNDFELRYQQWDTTPLVRVAGPPPQFFEQVNRLTARAQVKRWGFNIQVDEVLFVGTPYLLDGKRVSDPPPLITDCSNPPCVQSPFGESFYANAEKLAVNYKSADFEFTLGDFYTAFGYGAALNLNRNVDIDIDSSVQGLLLTTTPGDWEITGLAGTLNRQQVFADFINVGRLQGDFRHLVGGARIVRNNIGPATLGVHGVAYNFARDYGFKGAIDATDTPLDAVIGGATLDMYGVLGADWQFEADVVGFPLDEGQSILFADRDPELGHSLYGAAQFFLGSTVWQVEGKKYYNFQRVNRPTGSSEFYQVLTPPSLEYERAVNPDSQAALISDDIYGGRVQMDVIAGNVTPYVAVGLFRDQDLANSAQKGPAPETIYVGGLGAEFLLDKITLLTNWQGRFEQRDGDNGRDAQIYGDIDFKFPLWGEAHADLILFGQRFFGGPHAEDFTEDIDHSFTETSVSLSVAPNHAMGVTGYFDYTTNPVAQMGGNLGPTNFGAVEAYFKPSSAWTVRAFYGGYAAGIRCSGGQCRLVPAFTGARVAVTGTF